MVGSTTQGGEVHSPMSPLKEYNLWVILTEVGNITNVYSKTIEAIFI